jgi:hypothetical protein
MDTDSLEDYSANANMYVIFDDNGLGFITGTSLAITAGSIGNGIETSLNRITRMEIRVRDRHVVRDDDAPADLNRVGTHDDCTHENGVIPYRYRPRRFDIKSRPSIDLNSITDRESNWLFTAVSRECIPPLKPAVPSDSDIRWES